MEGLQQLLATFDTEDQGEQEDDEEAAIFEALTALVKKRPTDLLQELKALVRKFATGDKNQNKAPGRRTRAITRARAQLARFRRTTAKARGRPPASHRRRPSAARARARARVR